MAAKVPSISSSGWIGDIAEKADRLLSYYFVSEQSQTSLYLGQITSLPAQIQKWGHNEDELVVTIREQLRQFLERYFDGVEINVSTAFPVPNDPNRLNITVDCIVMEGDKQYSLGRMVSTANSKITQIVDINNFKGS